MASYQKRTEIRQFILNTVRLNPIGLVSLLSDRFQISRSSARGHLHRLVQQGLLTVDGPLNARKYQLKPLIKKSTRVDIHEGVQEDVIFEQNFAELLRNLPGNVSDICHYGFTEIVNNALHHSGGETVFIQLTVTAADVQFVVMDDGAGVFNTVQPLLNLEDRRHAVLEMAKGKFTTDPNRHSGEGLYFTTRCFDQFTISCSGVTLVAGADKQWSVESIQMAPRDGTYVSMLLSLNSTRTFNSVIESFTATNDTSYGFSRTEIPVNSARIGNTALTSRSQAERLLNRLDRFQEIVLDFAGVPLIGQAFADQIFRVYAQSHPHVTLLHKNANPSVARMITRALAEGRPTVVYTSAVVDAEALAARSIA